MSRDKLTGFDSERFTDGAVGGAMMISAALVYGALNVARANASALDRQTYAQFEETIRLVHRLVDGMKRELAEERADNRRLRAVLRGYSARHSRR